MKEHPIIFNTDMVKAILDGRKTQTRRVIKPQPNKGMEFKGMIFNWMGKAQAELDSVPEYDKDGNDYYPYGCFTYHPLCPYGQVGDRLWVRETWRTNAKEGISFKADEGSNWIGKWKPSIHMPRWASRITLEITEVRVERLQEITNDDVLAEGAATKDGLFFVGDRIMMFHKYWDYLNAKRGYGWDTNPWVWVISFKKEEKQP